MSHTRPHCFTPKPGLSNHALQRLNKLTARIRARQRKTALEAELEKVRAELSELEVDPTRWASDYHQLLARRECILEGEILAIENDWEGALA